LPNDRENLISLAFLPATKKHISHQSPTLLTTIISIIIIINSIGIISTVIIYANSAHSI